VIEIEFAKGDFVLMNTFRYASLEYAIQKNW